MSRLRRVTLTAEELKDGILTQTIGGFIDPRVQYRYSNEIAAIRWLCPTLEAKERNKDAVANLKMMLPAGTMSVVISGGIKEENVTEKNGVICIDIDGKDNPAITDWQAFKLELSKSRFIAYVGLSISGLGVFALIPLADPEQHKQHYAAIEQDFKPLKQITHKINYVKEKRNQVTSYSVYFSLYQQRWQSFRHRRRS